MAAGPGPLASRQPPGRRSLSGYWLAATLCAGAWLIWGEQWLGGCGDIVLVLLSAAILPYGQIFYRYYGGWPWENSGLTAAVGAAAVLFWCLAHLLWYVRLSRPGKRAVSAAGGNTLHQYCRRGYERCLPSEEF